MMTKKKTASKAKTASKTKTASKKTAAKKKTATKKKPAAKKKTVAVAVKSKKQLPSYRAAPESPLERVALGHLTITGNRIRAGDPSFLGEYDDELKTFGPIPNGRFPVYADIYLDDGEEVVQRLLLIFDEARFEETDRGRYVEPLRSVNVDASMLALIDDARKDAVRPQAALEPLWSALTASSTPRARRVARVSVGGTDALIACIPNFGDGTYQLCWWYGENVGSAPYQDVVAVGVVMDSKLLL